MSVFTSHRALPLPSLFSPQQARQYHYQADTAHLASEAMAWRTQHNIAAPASDEVRTHLLLIDVQKDFCFPEGSLYVGGRSGTGAMDDSQRIAEFIYRNLAAITDITATMDTHLAFQIFFPQFWQYKAGAPLVAHQVISADEIASGQVKPNPAVAKWLCNGNYTWLCKQVEYYCRELEKAGKYQLYLWPPHCLLGSDGHALAGVVQAARMFHAYARTSQSSVEVKGGNPLTENYSVLRPEVLDRFDGGALAQRNIGFLSTLLSYDRIFIAGQAASHCVKSTIDDLLAEVIAVDPQLAKKIYLLEDCMSSVAVPDGKGGFAADFTDQAKAAMQRFANAGMQIVKSTETL
jgi:nicotinamidase-related amidase